MTCFMAVKHIPHGVVSCALSRMPHQGTPDDSDFPGSESKVFANLDTSERNMTSVNRPPHYGRLIRGQLPITTRGIKDGNLCHTGCVASLLCGRV